MSEPTIADLQRQIEELTSQLKQAQDPAVRGEVPRYRLLQSFFAPDDVLYPEGAEIALVDCPPNENMEPLNDAARKAMIPVLQAITKKPLDQQIYDAKVALHERDRLAAEPAPVTFPKASAESVPIMPNHILPGAKRPRGRPRKVLEAKLPEADGRPKPPVMGTVVVQGRDGAITTGAEV